MKNENPGYFDEAEKDSGAQLTAVSYDRTQTALVTAGRATVGGKAVTAEISGIATGRKEDGAVNIWLSAFNFRGRNGAMKKAPGLNAVATLAPRQGAIVTAKAIAAYVNAAKSPYKATTSGSRLKAIITIAFTGKYCLPA